MSNYDKLVPDIVHQYDGQWWFWDETWLQRHGPYVSQKEAGEALRIYIDEHLEHALPEVVQDDRAGFRFDG